MRCHVDCSKNSDSIFHHHDENANFNTLKQIAQRTVLEEAIPLNLIGFTRFVRSSMLRVVLD